MDKGFVRRRRPDCQSLAVALVRMPLRRGGRTFALAVATLYMTIVPEREDRIKPSILQL